jgi:hypothetical protein
VAELVGVVPVRTGTPGVPGCPCQVAGDREHAPIVGGLVAAPGRTFICADTNERARHSLNFPYLPEQFLRFSRLATCQRRGRRV